MSEDFRGGVFAGELGCFLEQVAYEQASQDVGYVELRISPERFLVSGLSWQQVFETCHATAMRTTPLELRFILLLNRSCSTDFIEAFASQLAGLPSSFVGVDLAGRESSEQDSSRFQVAFDEARRRGLGITVHAGEFGPASMVWEALDSFGAHRVAHALSAVNDRRLLARLASEGIVVESSVSSNLATGAFPRKGEHPILGLLEAGVSICLNTDVPRWSGATLDDEYRMVEELIGWDAVETARDNAWRARFRWNRPQPTNGGWADGV